MKDIIIVTGGCSGLGYELVKKSLEQDFFVCNLARNKEKMDKLDEEFIDNYKGFIGDISDEEFVKKSIKEISKIGNIKYLINCAEKGVFKATTEYTSHDINVSFAGLKGMILCTTEVLKAKKEQDVKIVNIMSSAALKGNKKEEIYCATKWGERGYTESLKTAYKGTSVKVIGVYPGGMNTDFWTESRDYVSEEKSNSFMKPEEVAHVIMDNLTKYSDLNVADIIIERN